MTAARRWGLFAAVAGSCAALTSALAALASWQRWSVPAMLVMPVALVMLALGLDLLAGWSAWWVGAGDWCRHHVSRPASWLLLAIVLLGVVFRFGTFGDFPPADGFPTVEEAQAGQAAFDIITVGLRPWQHSTTHYLSAALFAFTGPKLAVHRLIIALLGCVTVPLFYLFVRALVGVPAALVTTALLAASRWHVQSSWYNLLNFTPLCGFVLGLVFVVHSGPTRRPSLTIGAAALAGMSLFEYMGFRPLLLIAIAVIVSRLSRRHAALFALTLLPFSLMFVGALRSDVPTAFIEPFLRHMSDHHYYTSDAGAFIQLRTARLTAAMKSVLVKGGGEFFGTLNVNDAPVLDPVTAVLFVGGLGVALAYPRRRYHLLIVGSFIFLLVGCTVVAHNLDYLRYTVLTPFVFAFVALALDEAFRLLNDRRVVAVVVAVVLAGAVGWNADFLFRKLAPSHAVRAGHRNDYTTASFFLKRHWRGERVILLTPEDGYYPFNFFDRTIYTWLLPTGLHGSVVPTVDAAIAAARDGATPVLIVAQRELPLEWIVVEVPRLLPSATCALYPDPDSRSFDLAACRILR